MSVLYGEAAAQEGLLETDLGYVFPGSLAARVGLGEVLMTVSILLLVSLLATTTPEYLLVHLVTRYSKALLSFLGS